jgi:hypothetical protein
MSDSILHPDTEKLQSFVEGTLDEGGRAVLESHLLGCSTCQSEVDEWRSLFTVLATLPQFSPSPKFADHIMASIQLPDPWYVRALVRVGDRAHGYAPKTTRGWALAAACLALPLTLFGVFATWLLSKPYMTASNIFAFTMHRSEEFLTSTARGMISQALQTDVALFLVRQLDVLNSAGVGAAGALLAGIAVTTIVSMYILYQNLFRANERKNDQYASYSF